MPSFQKPNATGRSSGKMAGRARKLRSPPEGEAWVWHTREMLASDAWRAMSLTARRLMDFLLIEHANHAALENGALIATHDQLTAFGLSRRLISDAVAELVFLGLIRVERGRLTRGGVKAPNFYRLTFYADREGHPATNEWKGVAQETIRAWDKHRRAAARKPTPPGRYISTPKKWVRENCEKPHLALVQPPQSGCENG